MFLSQAPDELGSMLVEFFRPAGGKPRSVSDFFEETTIQPRVAGMAIRKLEDAGLLERLGSQPQMPAMLGACYMSTLRPGIASNFADYLVGGFQLVRKKLGPGVLHVVVKKSNGDLDSGSAFLIADQLALTARHCVESEEIRLLDHNEDELPISNVRHSDADFAVIELDAPTSERVTFDVGEPVHLGRVMAMGYPRLKGLHPSLVASTGEVSGLATSFLDHNSYWLTTCALTGGSSGGPVVDEVGQVVGVVSALPAEHQDERFGAFGVMVSPHDGFASLAQ